MECLSLNETLCFDAILLLGPDTGQTGGLAVYSGGLDPGGGVGVGVGSVGAGLGGVGVGVGGGLTAFPIPGDSQSGLDSLSYSSCDR